jgi:NMD protein affecting ribosome stability and mRNA decay
MSIPQLQVANCPRCGKIFQKNSRNQCIDCCRELDSALTRCLDFLHRNHKATEEQISQDTGVPTEFIKLWIKEGRLHISDYPNLNYPCSFCGKPIRQHKMCLDCLVRLNKDIQQLKERERSNPLPEGGFQIRDRLASK